VNRRNGKKKLKKSDDALFLQIKLLTDLNLLVNPYVIFNLWPDKRRFSLPPLFVFLPLYFLQQTTHISNFMTNQPPTTNPITPILCLSISMFWFKFYWRSPLQISKTTYFFIWIYFKMLIFIAYFCCICIVFVFICFKAFSYFSDRRMSQKLCEWNIFSTWFQNI